MREARGLCSPASAQSPSAFRSTYALNCPWLVNWELVTSQAQRVQTFCCAGADQNSVSSLSGPGSLVKIRQRLK